MCVYIYIYIYHFLFYFNIKPRHTYESMFVCEAYLSLAVTNLLSFPSLGTLGTATDYQHINRTGQEKTGAKTILVLGENLTGRQADHCPHERSLCFIVILGTKLNVKRPITTRLECSALLSFREYTMQVLAAAHLFELSGGCKRVKIKT